MSLKREYIVAISIWYFISGCEMVCYQPILPNYIQYIGADESLLGPELEIVCPCKIRFKIIIGVFRQKNWPKTSLFPELNLLLKHSYI